MMVVFALMRFAIIIVVMVVVMFVVVPIGMADMVRMNRSSASFQCQNHCEQQNHGPSSS